MNNSLDITKDNSVAKHIIAELDIFYYNHLFYHYDDGYWKPYDKDFIKGKLLEILEEKYKQSTVNNIIDIIKVIMKKSSENLNTNINKGLVNLKNGMFSFKENTLIEHSHETQKFYSTNQFQVNYIPGAKCERWEKFVDEIFEFDDDKEQKIMLLQEYLGLCLTPITTFQKSLLLLGSGSNGKSIVLRVLEAILGKENYSNIELHQLSNKHYIVELQNKLVNFCSEIDFKGSFSTDIFKRVVASETLTGDAKFKDPIKFQPYCKLIFATNDLPKTTDTTKGYFRRLLILKFNRSFEGAQKDPHLFESLLIESDGILLWILEGLNRLLNNKKFTIPPSSEQEIEDYLESSNSIVAFIRECCEIRHEDTHWEAYQDLYNEYKLYCSDSGLRPFQKSNFKNEILRHYQGKIILVKTGPRGRHFKNIRFIKASV